jgi:4-amino-4-deoxy-L-arabinose transferase-like glycosyltransferase
MLPSVSTSWPTRSPVPPPSLPAPVTAARGAASPARARTLLLSLGRRRGELAGLIVLAGLLYTWALSRNGWANDYYSAAVRSMSSSWHDFLFASLDRTGVMTVDKPPLALWVQSLSARVFGYHPLSILLPQAVMGVASVVLIYDLVRRRFGRRGGFVAGLALALTPMTVAISRHNNPDALLVLCSVAALWCAVRALEDGRTRWLVMAGACVGLGFETKMGVALTVLPGITAAWLWVAPRGRLRAFRQLLAGGATMVIVGGAWPALVALTPAADRPWVSGTSDNSILSLILSYNGLGRVDGQAGGPAGGGPGGAGNMFGSTPGPLRLLNSALGGQAGWLLGFALVSGLAILAASRLRRADPRTGWLLAAGGAFLVTAVLFSAASGIFHPYYVSLLAPFTAALVGAGAGELFAGRLKARVAGPVAIAAGVACELIVLGDYPGQLAWMPAVLIVTGALAVLALLASRARRTRLVAVGGVLAALLLAPAVWSVDTLAHAASGTFPAGGPSAVQSGGQFVGGGPFGLRGGPFGGSAPGPSGTPGSATGGAQRLFGGGSPGMPSRPSSAPAPGGTQAGGPPEGGAPPGGARAAGTAGGGGPFGGEAAIGEALSYIEGHGGGTLAVSSQSSASSAIISRDAAVAGIGGFSGRESDVSAKWLAGEVRSGRIRWVLAEEGRQGGLRLPGDTRAGSKAAMSAVASACRAVTLSGSAGSASTSASGSGTRLYDCQGRAAALERA